MNDTEQSCHVRKGSSVLSSTIVEIVEVEIMGVKVICCLQYGFQRKAMRKAKMPM